VDTRTLKGTEHLLLDIPVRVFSTIADGRAICKALAVVLVISTPASYLSRFSDEYRNTMNPPCRNYPEVTESLGLLLLRNRRVKRKSTRVYCHNHLDLGRSAEMIWYSEVRVRQSKAKGNRICPSDIARVRCTDLKAQYIRARQTPVYPERRRYCFL
jgi:hypothetical protein